MGDQHDICYDFRLYGRIFTTGENSRFGVIEFAIGCNVTKEFKQAVAQVEEFEWKPIYKTAYGKKYKTGVEAKNGRNIIQAVDFGRFSWLTKTVL